MPPLYLIEWGIIGFFVLIHFIFGFIRGGSKSTYFSIVSIVMTIVTLFIVSKISLNLIFSTFMSLETMVNTISGMVGFTIPAEYLEYILNPSLSAFAIAVIDLVLKIVSFFVLYPIIKWTLTISIFRPIWKYAIKEPLLKKQNQAEKEAFEEKNQENKKYKPTRKLKKPLMGRLGGAFMGALRGFVVGVVFLLPVIVITGFVSGVENILVYQNDGTVSLGSDGQEIIQIPSEVQQILEQITELNEKGVGAFTSQITVNGQSADRYLFDMVFSSDIVVDGEVVGDISLGTELEGILGIAEILINGGYLEDGFSYESISSDNLEDIEAIFGFIGQSTLIQSMIPIGTRFAVTSILPDMIDGTNLYDNPATASALDTFAEIDWANEFYNVYGIIEAVLEFGSVEELMAYADDPLLLLELSPEEATRFTNIIRAFGNLETLYLLNAGVDFVTSYDQVLSQISWLDEAERETYLKEKFAFILDNPEFFVGDTGEIGHIADFIEAIYSNPDVSVRDLYEASGDLEQLFALQDPEWIGELMDAFVDIELLMNTLPLGVDFALYNAFGDQIERDIADQLSEALADTSWDEEVLNVGNIYQEVLTLGIEAILGDNPNYYTFIDTVAVEHMASIRQIMTYIFEDSDVINAAIQYASPVIIDTFIEDQALKDLVETALISDPVVGEVDFSFGTEINSILTMVESIYSFTTTEELVSLSSMTTDAQLQLIANFGSMPQTNFDAFNNAIAGLQIFDRVGQELLEYVDATQDIPQLYVPTEVSLGDDLASLMNFVYYAANYVYEASLTTPYIEDVDFAELLADDTFRSYLLPTEENHSQLLISTIAHNLMYYANDPAISAYLVIPDTLLNASPEDPLWDTEIANLFGAVFDLGAYLGGTDALTLSVREMATLMEDPMQAPIELLTQFADNDMTLADDAFGGLDASLIFRNSISQVIESVGSTSLSFIEGYEVTFPEIAMENGVIKEDMFTEFIWGVASLLDEANQTLGFETFAEVSANQDNYLYVTAFNQINDQAFTNFSEITILRGLISDLLLNPDVQAYVRNMVNETGFVQVSDQFFAFERDEDILSVDDIAELFISMKSLQVTPEFYYSPGEGIYSFLGSRTDEQLDAFFNATILREIFTYALTDDELVLSLADKVNTLQSFMTLPNDFFTVDEAVMMEDGLIKSEELRNLIVAISAFGFTDSASLSALNEQSFIHLIDPETEDALGRDGLERLLSSNYIYIMLDRALSLDSIGTFAGTTLNLLDEFGDPISLVPPQSIKVDDPLNIVENGRLPKAEFRRLITSISMLGDFAALQDVSVVLDLLTSMIGDEVDPISGDDGFDRFMSSDYLYYLISTVLEAQDAIVVPLLAYEDSGMYEGLIKKSEIRSVLNTLVILSVTDPNMLDPDTITIDDLQSIIAQGESFLVNYLLSQAMIEALDPNNEGIIPDEAFEGNPEDGLLSYEEISAIVDALAIVAGGDPDATITGIDFELITVGQVDELSQNESIVIKQMVTDTMKSELDPNDEGKIPLDAYENQDPNSRLTQAELDAMVVALYVLAHQDPDLLISNISYDITISQVTELRDGFGVPGEVLGVDSLIIQQMVSDQVITILGVENIPADAYTDVTQTRLTQAEIINMIGAIEILNTEDPAITLVEDLNVNNVTVGQVDELNQLPSMITKKLISNQIIDQLDPLDEGKIPAEAFSLADPTILSDEELDAMVVALFVLANDDPSVLVTAISTDVTVGQAAKLKDGNGIPGETLGVDSYTIQQLISDQVVTIIGAGNIPDDAYTDLTLTRLTQNEIIQMIEAIVILNGVNPSTTLVADVDPNSVTVGQVDELNALPSLVTKQLISNSIVDQIDPLDEGKIPLEAYRLDYPTILTNEELDAMVVALYVLANDDPSVLVTAIDTDVTVGQAAMLKDGHGVPGETLGVDSYIIQQLVSDQVVDILGVDNIPDDSYIDVAKTRLTQAEIINMIGAIEILNGDNPTTTPVALVDPNTVTVGQVEELNALPSLITKQLISNSIVDQIDPLDEGKIPLEAYRLDYPSILTDAELEAMVVALYVLANDDPSVLVTAIDTDVTVGQAAKLKDGNGIPGETLGIDSYIIQQLVSDQVVDILGVDNIPDDSYIDVAKTRLTQAEIINMIGAIEILNGDNPLTTPVALVDPNNVTVGQVEELNALPSLITKQLISNSIVDQIDPLDEGKIPLEAYRLDYPTILTDDELEAMVVALYVLANDDPDMLVTAIDTDVTVAQAAKLKDGNGIPGETLGIDSLIIQQLVSDQVVTILGVDNIPDSSYIDVAKTRLTQTEIINMIGAIEILNTGDPALTRVSEVSTADVTVGQVQELNLLPSLITKKIISNSIIDAIDPLDEGKIPLEAYDLVDPTRLTDDEITKMVSALEVLADYDLNTVVTDIDTNNITIGQVDTLSAQGSIIMDKTISDSIIDTIDPLDEGKIPVTAHIDDDPNKNLEPSEVSEMIEALRILAGKKTGDANALTDDVLVSAVTVDPTIYQVEAMNALSSEITAKMISDSIVDAIDPLDEGKVPATAHIGDDPNNNLKPAEVIEMIEALRILAGKLDGDPDTTTDDIVVSSITVDPTIYQVAAMNALSSEITAKLISDSIIDAIDPLGEGKVPVTAHIDDDPNKNLEPAEVIEMIEALRILAGKKTGDPDALTDPVVVSSITVDPTIGQVKLLNALTSEITTKLISDSIIDSIGVANVPIDAYIDDTPGNLLKQTEVDEMILALEILADDGNPLTDEDDTELDSINTRVTVGQTQSLKTNGSVIVKQLISDAITDMLTPSQIPTDAYRTEVGLDRLTDAEIEDMIDSLLILSGGNTATYVDEISFVESSFTVTTLKSFPDSLIMNRIISSGLITNMPNLPDESYLELNILDPEYKLDLLRIEIDNLLDALTILGIENPNNANNIGADSITFADLESITVLGTVGEPNEHPLGYSPIIDHILSSPMISAISDVRSGHDYGVPSTAMRNTHDLLYDEVLGLIDALELIGNVGTGVGQNDPATTTMFDVSSTLDPSTFGPTLLGNLIALDSLVVYRMISIGMHDAGITNADAYAIMGDRNYDPNLPALPVLEDVKITEMNHVVASMVILNITSVATVATEITVAKLQALTPVEIEFLVESIADGPNTIIYYIISDVVDPDNDLYPTPAGDSYYVYDGPTRIRLKRSSIAAALLLL